MSSARLAALLRRRLMSRPRATRSRCAPRADIDADDAIIWSTLSDYDRLAAFIPGMSASRTVARNGVEAVVEQKGYIAVGPFRRNFAVLLAMNERQNQSITASAIGGDFRCFESRYRIEPLAPHRSRIVYQATLVPAIALPPIVGSTVMRFVIGAQFQALLDEIERRATVARMAATTLRR